MAAEKQPNIRVKITAYEAHELLKRYNIESLAIELDPLPGFHGHQVRMTAPVGRCILLVSLYNDSSHPSYELEVR